MKASIFMLFDLFTMPKQLHCVEVSETVRKSSSHQRKSNVVNGHETEMTPVENEEEEADSHSGLDSPCNARTRWCHMGEIDNCGTVSAKSSDSNQSDGSSTESFSFPVMHWELIGSPVQMPKSESLHARKHKAPCAHFSPVTTRPEIIRPGDGELLASPMLQLGTLTDDVTETTTIRTPFDSTCSSNCVSIFHWIIQLTQNRRSLCFASCKSCCNSSLTTSSSSPNPMYIVLNFSRHVIPQQPQLPSGEDTRECHPHQPCSHKILIQEVVFSIGVQEGKQSLPLVLLTQPPDYSPQATCPPSLPMSLKGRLMNIKKGAAHRAEFNKTNLRPCPCWLSQMKSTKSGGEKSKILTLFSLTVKSFMAALSSTRSADENILLKQPQHYDLSSSNSGI
ncbi:hypothetical protein NC652_034731 [Populus alba x Populus x berolinensis]|nr:hypothetical protein NC652_034731 [Populus alba x Populus x berolinensis]